MGQDDDLNNYYKANQHFNLAFILPQHFSKTWKIHNCVRCICYISWSLIFFSFVLGYTLSFLSISKSNSFKSRILNVVYWKYKLNPLTSLAKGSRDALFWFFRQEKITIFTAHRVNTMKHSFRFIILKLTLFSLGRREEKIVYSLHFFRQQFD